MKYLMRREGKFDIRLAQGNQCGMAGDLDFRYEFFFEASTLDNRSFLIDHHSVDNAIQSFSRAGVYRGSCEQLAVSLGVVIASRLRQDVTDGILTVKLSGSTVAGITVIGGVRTAKFNEFLDTEPRFKLVEGEDLYPGAVDVRIGEPFVELKKGQANKKRHTKEVTA